MAVPTQVVELNQSSNVNSASNQSYGPFFLEYSLMAEYNLLQKQNLPGIYILPSARSPLLWFGCVFIRQGLFQGGIFKFCILIPPNYPDGDCPRILFDNPPYHPLVSAKTGELDVKRAFVKWKRNMNHIWNVLLYVRRIFYKIDTTDPLNPDAAKLYETELRLFKEKVIESIALSKTHLYDPPKTDDPHELIFMKGEQKIHDSRKASMLNSVKETTSVNSLMHHGLSWVASGQSIPFSKNIKMNK